MLGSEKVHYLPGALHTTCIKTEWLLDIPLQRCPPAMKIHGNFTDLMLPNVFLEVWEETEKWHWISCLTKLTNFCVGSYGHSQLSGSPQVLPSRSRRAGVSCWQTVPEYMCPGDCGPDGKKHKLWGEPQTAKDYNLYQQVLSPACVLFS